jgi:hypothetical protein
MSCSWRKRGVTSLGFALAMIAAGCTAAPEQARGATVTTAVSSAATTTAAHHVGQWIWTRTDIARFAESAVLRPALEAGVFIGSVHCDAATGRLVARAALSAASAQVAVVTPVIRFEDGLYACRNPRDSSEAFELVLDSAVHVLRARVRSVAVQAVQLDFDAPQRAIGAWSRSVRFMRTRSLAGDSVWITSLIAHLRQPEYGTLFRGVVDGHVLQVFDTGEEANEVQIAEVLRLTKRAAMPFRVGLGAFERQTRAGPTNHRAWFAAVAQLGTVRGYSGIWVFPAGQRWITHLRETT